MTESTTRQVRFSAPGLVEIEERSISEPGSDEVLVAMNVAGICGSDLHALAGKHPFIDLPCQPGHEIAGTVLGAGADVADFAPGDRVLVEPNLVCGTCPRCREGRYNICDQLVVFGCQTPGGMADRFVIAAHRLHAIPPGMTDTAAALVEPLSTATHAVRVAGGDLTGKQVAVLGAGSIGLLTMLAARAAGAETVIVTDLLASKRERAEALGASATLDAAGDVVRQSRDHLEGRVDVTFDCVANEVSLRQAMGLASKGGTVVVVGVPTGPAQVDLPMIQDQEIRLEGALMYTADDMQRSMQLLASDQVPATAIVTGQFPLHAAAEAFEAARSGEHIKVQLVAGT